MAFTATLPGDSAHDAAHLRRVVALARILAAAEGARLEIVFPAAWLHDCAAVPKDSPHRAQASVLAADRALTFLAEAGYPAAYLPEIWHCIEAHSYSAGITPRTLEARVVQDADRLDALGAIGIARCFAVGGALHRALYRDVDPFCKSRAPDDSRFTVDHFFQKLFPVAETMQTAAGRAEGLRRTAFMRAYLEQLAAEISGGSGE